MTGSTGQKTELDKNEKRMSYQAILITNPQRQRGITLSRMALRAVRKLQL